MLKLASLLLLVCGAFAGPGPRNADGDLDTSAQTLVPVGAEPIFPPQPYSYAYDSPNLGGHHGHEESGDGSGRVSGRYFLSDADGRVRTVTYVADEFGFRADVVTNEPGTESRSPADTTFTSSALPGPDAAAAFESTRLGGPGAVLGGRS
ncbi:hypothetical protein HPB47_028077 [Ixodes persulcatus]|uniref:Uncharacterized protein n=1 Tax=Ixodes persulcatus TaxID=34615 RepID=A0AC60PU79_IXOPE|nr:hypothetical protein HPB47_028077 [Ixodes persulcatus]